VSWEVTPDEILDTRQQQVKVSSKGGGGHDSAGAVSWAIVHNMLQRKMYFVGLPAPMGAAWAMFPMNLSLSSKLTSSLGAVGEAGAWAVGRHGAAVTLFVTVLLMVSSLLTLSSKMLKPESDSSHLQ